MKEHAISFNGEMVRATLDGRKTQTRLVMPGEFSYCRMSGDNEPCWVWWPKGGKKTATCPPLPVERWSEHCPYGIPGDRLWIKEAWATEHRYDDRYPREITENPVAPHLHYAATEELGGLMKRPAISMPRWASRITLEIVSVRIERVREISDLDIAAEGLNVQFHEEQCATASIHLPKKTSYSTARGCFALLWDSINRKRKFKWNESPWVWVIEFKRV